MKVVVVGCTHAGTASVKTILNDHPEAEVVVYERNDNVSFLSCGIALYVGGVVKDPQGLFYSSPEELASAVKQVSNLLPLSKNKASSHLPFGRCFCMVRSFQIGLFFL